MVLRPERTILNNTDITRTRFSNPVTTTACAFLVLATSDPFISVHKHGRITSIGHGRSGIDFRKIPLCHARHILNM